MNHLVHDRILSLDSYNQNALPRHTESTFWAGYLWYYHWWGEIQQIYWLVWSLSAAAGLRASSIVVVSSATLDASPQYVLQGTTRDTFKHQRKQVLVMLECILELTMQ